MESVTGCEDTWRPKDHCWMDAPKHSALYGKKKERASSNDDRLDGVA